jgi:hypothetical protein
MKANYLLDSDGNGVGWGTWKWDIESSIYGLTGSAGGYYTGRYMGGNLVSAQCVGRGLNGWNIRGWANPNLPEFRIDYGALLFSLIN